MDTLRDTLSRHGMTQASFARAAGVDKATVTRWAQKKVPADKIVEIEEKTGVSRFELRPDLYTVANKGRA